MKVIENNRQGAKTASPIRKRPAGSRRTVSWSQPQAQELYQLAEAASAAEPANRPPSSGQSTASTANASDDQELPPVRTIARHASVRSRVSRSPSSSLTDEPKEYYIECTGKELLYLDVVPSDKWDLPDRFRGSDTEDWWNKMDNHVERLCREGKSDIRVTVVMRFDIEENAVVG